MLWICSLSLHRVTFPIRGVSKSFSFTFDYLLFCWLHMILTFSFNSPVLYFQFLMRRITRICTSYTCFHWGKSNFSDHTKWYNPSCMKTSNDHSPAFLYSACSPLCHCFTDPTCPSFNQVICCHEFGSWLWQEDKVCTFPCHVLEMRHIIPPGCSWSCGGFPISWSCAENIHIICLSTQRSSFSTLRLSKCPKGEPRHPAKATHGNLLNRQSHCYVPYLTLLIPLSIGPSFFWARPRHI